MIHTPSAMLSGGAASTPSLTASVGSKREYPGSQEGSQKRRARGSRSANNKGLRHFSMKVCEKVEQRGKTTYNEVADDLVKEFSQPDSDVNLEDKNIRRRVYDALNVLMAMDIISKDRRQIIWRGLPTHSEEELKALRDEHRSLQLRLWRRKQFLRELLLQQIAYKRLLERNKQAASGAAESEEKKPKIQVLGAGAASGEAVVEESEEPRIALPFVLVCTDKNTTVHIDMEAPSRRDMFLNFSAPFDIHDDCEILKKMGLQEVTKEEAEKYIPKQMIPYLDASSPPEPINPRLLREGTQPATEEPEKKDAQHRRPLASIEPARLPAAAAPAAAKPSVASAAALPSSSESKTFSPAPASLSTTPKFTMKSYIESMQGHLTAEENAVLLRMSTRPEVEAMARRHVQEQEQFVAHQVVEQNNLASRFKARFLQAKNPVEQNAVQAEYEQEHELEIKREITLWNKIVENQTKELKRYVNSVK